MPSSAQLAEIKSLIDNSLAEQEPQEEVLTEDKLPEEIEIEAPETTEELEAPEVEGEQAEEQAESDEQGEVDQLKTINDWAEAIEVDSSDLYGMEIPMSDGQEPVKLGELKDRYQEVLRENSKLQQVVEQIPNQQPMMSQEVMAAYGQLNELQRQYQETNWEKLEEEDSGKAALLRQKYQEAYQVAQAQIAQAKQKQQAIRAQAIQKAAVDTIELIPEWKEETTRHEEINKIQSLLLDAGYTPGIVNNMADPIAFKLARELMQLREEKAKAQEAVKNMRKQPKPLKTTGRPEIKQDNKIADLVNRAKKSNNKKLKHAAVKALLAKNAK